jgi:hypothetical protein
MIWPFNKERRSWPRREVRLDVMYGTTPPLTLTSSVDMSSHSLAFKSSKAYDLGTPLEVQVLVNSAHPDAGWFYAEGKVARIGTGVVAVEFIKISSQDARKLDAFFVRLGPSPASQ